MRKFDIFKTIQLLIFIVLAGLGLFLILTDSRLYQLVATDSQIRTLCVLLWAAFGLSFLFIFMDFTLFSSFKREYRELDFAVHSDPVSGIANRNSCDALIEKYLDKPLPENLGCIMFDLTNIKEINKMHGHIQGNNLIRDFSAILQSVSINLCFVGRNGGNKFLAIFEECTEEKLKDFLKHVEDKVDAHNSAENSFPIAYCYGIAFHEGNSVNTITDLISLSNRRIYNVSKNSEETK